VVRRGLRRAPAPAGPGTEADGAVDWPRRRRPRRPRVRPRRIL